MSEDQLAAILSALNASSADIQASALISADGFVIASALADGMDEDRVSALIAATLSLGERTAQELSRGGLEQVMISGKHGSVLIVRAGATAVMCAIAAKTAKLGQLFQEASAAVASILVHEHSFAGILQAHRAAKPIAAPEPAPAPEPIAAAPQPEEDSAEEPPLILDSTYQLKSANGLAHPAAANGADHSLHPLCADVGFNLEDQKVIKSLQSLMRPLLPSLTARFYKVLLADPQMAAYIQNRVDTLKSSHTAWLENLFDGDYGANFVHRQQEIGKAHTRAEIPPIYFAASMAFLRAAFPSLITANISNPVEQAVASGSLLRLLDLCQYLIDPKYYHALIRLGQAQKQPAPPPKQELSF